MEDILHQKADRDIFFNSFDEIGSQLDQLIFDFEEIENGVDFEEIKNRSIPEEPEDITEEATPPVTLETKVQDELERNIDDDEIHHHRKEHSKFYTMTFQRAFSTVSLMTNFKSNFWKRRRGKHPKHQERRNSTASEPETNNNHGIPLIKVCEESEGRATIYSTVPRPPKNFGRSKTMSPSRHRPDKVVLDGVGQLECSASSNVYVPPVIIDGQKIHEYQYTTPESSPVHKSKDFSRRNSLSRLFGRRKSSKKSTNKEASPKPIKALYERTVPTASNGEVNIYGVNEATKPNCNYTHANGHSKVIKHEENVFDDVLEAPIQL